MSQTIINLAGRKRTGKESAFKLLVSYVARPEEFQFATPLKKFCMDVLGLTYEQCYGDSSSRETLTKYQWADVAPWIREKYGKSPDEMMTARSVLQVVGTDLMRQSFYKDIWAEAGIRQITQSSAQTAIITDCRFPEELTVTRRAESSLIVRLYRETGLNDGHDSETALDNLDACLNQRSINSSHHKILEERGYSQLNKSLWKSLNPAETKFDYLVDNNHTLEDLRKNMIYILKEKNIFLEPSLS